MLSILYNRFYAIHVHGWSRSSLAWVSHLCTPINARTAVRSRAPVMEFFEVHEQSIVDLQAAQTAGRVTSRGLVDSYLARIQAYDQAGPRLNAIVHAQPARARRGRGARS